MSGARQHFRYRSSYEPIFPRHDFPAIDVLEPTLIHADMSRFLLKAGQEIKSAVRGEGTSIKKRLNDLVEFVDNHPDYLTDDGPLEMLIINEAVDRLLPYYELPYQSELPELPPIMDTFRLRLQQDGFVFADGSLRPKLPVDIGVPGMESELIQLLEAHGFSTAKGHLEQAFDAHADGNWASANAQIRTFVDALFDKIAEKLDPNTRTVGSGHPRRDKLAKLGFFDTSLNEWEYGGKGFINGLIRRLHPQGPHPGLSDEDDSTFRLHLVLLTALLFLRRYDQRAKQ